MPRIPAGKVTESGEIIETEPEKRPKKKVPVPHDWKTKQTMKRLRDKKRKR